jgi:hypothetical protein
MEATHFLTAAMTALLSGKCCPRCPFFIGPNKWKSEGKKFGLYGGCGRTVQPNSCNVSHGLQTGMEPGVIMLQEEGCLLCPDSGNSGLQLSQGRNVAVRIDGLFVFQEIREAHTFPIPRQCTSLYPLMAAS